MKTDLWSPSMMFTNVKTATKAKKLKKKHPENSQKSQKTPKNAKNAILFQDVSRFF